MKKYISIFTVIVIIFSIPMISSFAAIQQDGRGNYNYPNNEVALNMISSGTESIGSVISTVGDVSTVGFICPSWSDDIGSLTVTLWRWDTDYNTTKATDPLCGPTVFENYEDNSFVGFNFETPLAAGVYFIELSDPDDYQYGVGVWTTTMAYPGQLTFVDGEYNPKLSLRMQVDYVTPLEEGAAPYGELPKIEIPRLLGGEGTDPHRIYLDFSKLDFSHLEDSAFHVNFVANEDGTLHVIVPEEAFDSQFILRFSDFFENVDINTEIPCEKYPYMAIRMKIRDNSYYAGCGEAFFFTTTYAGPTAGYSASVNYDWTTTDWQTVVVDPTENKMFIENAKSGDCWLGFRFDPINATPSQDVSFDVAWIAFFENEEAAWSFDGDFSAFESLYFIFGDADADGEVTDWDSILLSRYLAGWKVEISVDNMDIDFDGDISDWDSILLQRYLAGWRIQLGPIKQNPSSNEESEEILDFIDADGYYSSFDTLFINGVKVADGSSLVSYYLDSIGGTINGIDGSVSSIGMRGWAGFTEQAIVSYGYQIDDGSVHWDKSAAELTEPAVLAAGGAYAHRFNVTIPVSEITGQGHLLKIVLKLEDGTVVYLNRDSMPFQLIYDGLAY